MPKIPGIIIWGASGHALVVADIIRQNGAYQLLGFIDDMNPQRKGSNFGGAVILGGREQLDIFRDQGVYLIMGFGDCEARVRLAELARAKGFNLGTAIHSQAIVASDVSIGAGSVVCAGAIINPGTHIGENVIINTGATVDHECVIAPGVHVGPGVHLGGLVQVGQAAWIGIGAVVKDRIEIGARAIIGAGAVVVRDIPEAVVAYGVPARVRRSVSGSV